MKSQLQPSVEYLFLRAYSLATRASEVRAVASVLAGIFSRGEFDDLRQEGLIACWRALRHFDPGRGSLRTFVERVVRNHFASLQRARLRRPQLTSMTNCERRMSRNWEREIDVSLDVRLVIGSLSDLDQRLVVALADHTPTEVGQLVGVARSTVYARIRHIRSVFSEAGLGPRGART